MTAPDLSVADVLRKAVDVLAERGWHQGDLRGRDGKVCAYGAICVALSGHATHCGPRSKQIGDALMRSLDWEKPSHDAWVGVWNDDPARSYEDVVLALKLAAADADLAGRVVAPPNAHTETEG